jgi:hypothetical protein
MLVKFDIEIDEEELKSLVINALADKLGGGRGGVPFNAKDVKIEVKSKQNFRSEWEESAYRARLSVRA